MTAYGLPAGTLVGNENAPLLTPISSPPLSSVTVSVAPVTVPFTAYAETQTSDTVTGAPPMTPPLALIAAHSWFVGWEMTPTE